MASGWGSPVKTVTDTARLRCRETSLGFVVCVHGLLIDLVFIVENKPGLRMTHKRRYHCVVLDTDSVSSAEVRGSAR